MKKCSNCKEQKSKIEFAPSQNYCKKCAAIKNKEYHKTHKESIKIVKKNNYNKHWAHNALRRAKSREKGYTVSIDEAYVLDLFNKQGGKCYWLGVKLDPTAPPRHPQRPSIDRLDNAKGYEPGNVVVSSWFANAGRNSIDVDTMKEFIENVLNVERRK